MATKKFKSIEEAKKYLINYRDKTLPSKAKLFVEKMAQLGVEVAKDKNIGVSGTNGTHKMEKLVTFSEEVYSDSGKYIGKIIGTGNTFTSTWDNGTKSEEVLPMHYLEFGTSYHGSLRWSFVDNEGNLFEWASGIVATRPLYNTWLELKTDYISVAKDVWS